MKIVAILGSPRPKSNSSGLANKILERTKELGAETQAFVLNKLQYKGCQACETCKTKLDHCVLKDDLTQVLRLDTSGGRRSVGHSELLRGGFRPVQVIF